MNSFRRTFSDLSGYWLLLLIGLLPLGLLLITPLGADNAVFQSMAIEWVRHGKWPYVGSWDQSFPAMILLHSIAVILFGESGFGFRLLDLFLQVGISLFLFKLWSLWLRPRVALMATLLFVFYYVHAGSTVMGQRDVYAIIAVLAGYYILFRSRSIATREVLTAGLMLGIAFAFRPTYALYCLAMVAVIPELRRIGRILLFGAAALAPMIIFLIIYAFIPGGLQAFYEATIRFNVDLYTQFNGPWSWFAAALRDHWFITIPAILCFVGLLWKRRESEAFRTPAPRKRTALILLGVFIAITVFCIMLQRKFLSYHFAPLFLLLTPIAAIGYERLLGPFKQRAIALFLVIGLLGALPKGKLLATAKAMRPGSNVFAVYDSIEFSNPLIGWTQLQRTQDYFAHVSHSGDRIEVINMDARLRALIAANSATRFTQVHSIGYRLDTSRFDESVHPAYQQRWRREFVDSLRSVKPAYIVLVRTSDSWYLRDPYLDVAHGIAGFDSLLERDYKLDTMIGGFQVFGRRDSVGGFQR